MSEYDKGKCSVRLKILWSTTVQLWVYKYKCQIFMLSKTITISRIRWVSTPELRFNNFEANIRLTFY